MDRNSITAVYEQSFRDWLALWVSADRRAAAEVSEGEAAYSVLENAGLWSRHRSDSALPDDLEQQTAPDRLHLVRAACRFATGFALPSHFDRLLAADALEPEELEEVEGVLAQIDGLDAVADLSARLVGSALDQDDELLLDLTRVRAVCAALVSRLEVRPDVLAVASRFLLVQREPRYSEGRPADWFTRLRELDRGFDDTSLGEFDRPAAEPSAEPSTGILTRLGRVLDEYAARVPSAGVAFAGERPDSWTDAQAELGRTGFVVEGDESVGVWIDSLFPPARSRPTLVLHLEPVRADVYAAFEVSVPGLPSPLRAPLDGDVGEIILDEFAWEQVRAARAAPSVSLVTADGLKRSVRERSAR